MIIFSIYDQLCLQSVVIASFLLNATKNSWINCKDTKSLAIKRHFQKDVIQIMDELHQWNNFLKGFRE